MNIRIFSAFLIKLFLVFCFFFSVNSYSMIGRCEWKTSQNLTLSQCVNYLSSTIQHGDYGHKPPFNLFVVRVSNFHFKIKEHRIGGVANWLASSTTCPDGSLLPDSGSCAPEPPKCKPDEILNPETNTCDARCTAPDVWDPVTSQCITPKNRCDILGERQPVVEVDWRQSTLGSSFNGQYSCMPSGCVVQGTNDVGCLSDNDRCYGDAKYTGTLCEYTEGVTSGWCSDETCSEQKPVDPVDPDNPNPEPPNPNPDPTPGDSLNPPNPDTAPDTTNPNLDAEANKGVVNELNTANKNLENIQQTLVTTLDEVTAQNKQQDKTNDKIVLGIQNLIKAVNDKPVGGGGGGGEGGGGEPSFVSGASCAAFECKGDAIACYIAKKQWEQTCDAEKAKQNDVPKITEAMNKIVADNPVENLNAGSLNVDTVMNKYTNGGGVTAAKGCPAPDTITTPIVSFTLNYSPFCDLAAVIRFFIISLALVGSALLIAKYGL